MSGWIKLHRSIVDSDIYDMPPLYLRVFERMILEANHQDKEIPYTEKGSDIPGKITIKRGERLTSVRDICRWVSWYERGKVKEPNPKTIQKILDWLEVNHMIEIYGEKGNRRGTHYKVLNYNIYQGQEEHKVTVDGEVGKSEEYEKQGNEENNILGNSKGTPSNTVNNSGINEQIGSKVTVEKHLGNSKVTVGGDKQECIKNYKNDNNINKYIYNGVQESKDDFVEDSHKELFENENLKVIASIYENNLGPVVGVISKDLIEISKTFQADMFEEAISIAARGGANTFNMNYIKGILRKWEDNNILNIDDLEALRNREQKAKEVSKPQKQTNYAPSKKTKFHNFQQRTDNYSEDDLERIARKKREAYYRKTQEKKQEETKEDDSNQGKVINFKFG